MSKAIVTIKVVLHEGDYEQIMAGKLDYRSAIELVLNHDHPFTVIEVEAEENVKDKVS